MRGEMPAAHAAKGREQGHIGQSRALAPADEHVRVALLPRQTVEDFDGAGGQRDSVFALGLHPLGRNDPGVAVDLVPGRADHFARSCGGQDCKFERARGDAFLVAQRVDESADLAIGQRGMMANARNLGLFGQELRKVAFPARRVVPAAVIPAIAAVSPPWRFWISTIS